MLHGGPTRAERARGGSAEGGCVALLQASTCAARRWAQPLEYSTIYPKYYSRGSLVYLLYNNPRNLQSRTSSGLWTFQGLGPVVRLQRAAQVLGRGGQIEVVDAAHVWHLATSNRHRDCQNSLAFHWLLHRTEMKRLTVHPKLAQTEENITLRILRADLQKLLQPQQAETGVKNDFQHLAIRPGNLKSRFGTQDCLDHGALAASKPDTRNLPNRKAVKPPIYT